MSDIALKNAAAYAARYNLRLRERLGFGIHGTVHVVEHEGNDDRSAVKAFDQSEFYVREREVYERLREAGITKVLAFHVPQIIRAEDNLHVIEMTIVTRPFVLDFAGAFLDRRPEFPEETWSDWELNKREHSATAGKQFRP